MSLTREEMREAATEMFFTPQELADRWRLDSVQTLSNQRSQKIGPPYVKLKTGKILYRVSDILEYERSSLKGLTLDAVIRAVNSCPWMGEFERRQLVSHLKAELKG
jgi:hypothetical protein